MTQSGACSSPGASGRGAELGKARKCRDVSFSSLFDRCMSPSQRVAHVSDSVTRLLTTPRRDMHMNSCGSVHGGGVHDNSSGWHVNSCGALGHKKNMPMYILQKFAGEQRHRV